MILSIALERDSNDKYKRVIEILNNQAAEIDELDIQWIICDEKEDGDLSLVTSARNESKGNYILTAHGGDRFSGIYLKELCEAIHQEPNAKIYIPKSKAAFRSGETGLIDLQKEIKIFPFYTVGSVFEADLFKGTDLNLEDKINGLVKFVFDMCLKQMKVFRLPNATYYTKHIYESDNQLYRSIHEKAWYNSSYKDFYLPYLRRIKSELLSVPGFVQVFLVYSIQCRLEANRNNKNKHVINEDEANELFLLMRDCLQFVDNDILFNQARLKEITSSSSVKWVFGIFKYGSEFKFETMKDEEGIMRFGYNGIPIATVHGLADNIVFMEYFNGRLEYDGTIHPVLYSIADEIYIEYGDKKYPLVYNGRYSLTKSLGVSLYKSHSFHVSINTDMYSKAKMAVFAKIGKEVVKIDFRFDSHFSRISDIFKNSYWTFKSNKGCYMVTHDDGWLIFRQIKDKEWKKQERRLQREMIKRHRKKDLLFLGIRQAYFKMKPILKKRPIWMYVDKIYKGGDSSEYLYRYASKQKDNIDHYYLIDKETAEYKKLKEDGFKPLIRGTIRHRLLFLMSDMMVISNSTIMAFNNYGLGNSSYIRDLIDFRVCCVQHGMSVQKIAVAQNRLRDNTRLYFCASKYEITNLSKPIYDYVGYEPTALKLTGVPRYDGLVDDDKKQIMISPTWRMQAALSIAKTNKSESTQREYNPLFKESSYFKVFNSLINDERLISAAKDYGYKIKYVLHPIVSSQIDDFDTNEYTEIIPAVGDMSYEKMFRESSLMVTDFSGIQFDFAYMRKPIVYLHHKDIPQHYEEGTFFYDTMAFGEITHDNDELIDVLIQYMKDGCKMKNEYRKRADDFFHFSDHKNCERIYDVMLDYQKRYIDK